MVLVKVGGRQVYVEGAGGLQKLDLRKGRKGRPVVETETGTVRGAGREDPPRVRLLRLLSGGKCQACGTSDERVLVLVRAPGTYAKGTATRMVYWYLRHVSEARRDLRVLCANCRALERQDRAGCT